MTSLISIRPTFVEHEGFYYLEFEGEFFKGCKRCGGEGHYSHNGDHSRCYDCDNTSAKLGEQLANRQAAEKWCHERAVRKAQRERKAEALRMAKVNKLAAKVESVPEDIRTFLLGIDLNAYSDEASYERSSFLRSMAEELQYVANCDKTFSPKMVEAVRKVIGDQQVKAAEAAAHPAPKGRVVVTGEVISTKVVESAYGMAFKILVKDDQGFKVYCSIPTAQLEEINNLSEAKGKRITFTATLEPTTDDVSFAWGSRPTKGSWL
jgi:hypothetical protein